MSLLPLYLRSRRVVPGGLVAVVLAVGLSVPTYSTFAELMGLFTVAAVVSVTATTLGAPDADLDRTAALPWRWWRVGHVVVVAGLATGLGTLLGPLAVATRNAVGLTGLAALAVTVLGGGLAWTLPLAWTVLAATMTMSGTTGVPLLTWPVQPAGTTAATVAACVLGGVGAVGYALAGPRPA